MNVVVVDVVGIVQGADAMASVIAHELAETVSDPQLNAWYGVDLSHENGVSGTMCVSGWCMLGVVGVGSDDVDVDVRK